MITKLLAIPDIFHWQQQHFNNYKNVRIEFLDYLESGSLKILDIGCSTGLCGQSIFNMDKVQYFGIDSNIKYIEFARHHYQNGTYIIMDARNLDFPDNTFNLVTLIGVIHHIDDEIILECLKEVFRVLKPEGHLLLAEPVFTPNALISNLFLSLDRGRYIRESSHYLSLLSGFEIARKRYFNFSLHRFISVIAKPNKLGISE